MACSGTYVALAVETWCSGTKLKFSATKLFCNVDQNGSWEGFGGGVDWIRLAQDRDRWLAVVSAVMNLWVLVP
jgi:hypothetical protein